MLDFIIFFLLWMAGGLFASYGIITPLIVIRTANPLIHALEQKNLINAGAARKRNCLTIIIWLCIDAAVIGLMLAFANKTAWIGFAIGGIIFTAIGIGKTGPTRANKEDFVQSYRMFFDSSKAEEVIETVVNYGNDSASSSWNHSVPSSKLDTSHIQLADSTSAESSQTEYLSEKISDKQRLLYKARHELEEYESTYKKNIQILKESPTVSEITEAASKGILTESEAKEYIRAREVTEMSVKMAPSVLESMLKMSGQIEQELRELERDLKEMQQQ